MFVTILYLLALVGSQGTVNKCEFVKIEQCWKNSDCKLITFNNGTAYCSIRCKLSPNETFCPLMPLNKDGTGKCVWTPASGGTPGSCGGDENVKEDNPLDPCLAITSEEKCWENSDCKFVTTSSASGCKARCKFFSGLGETICTSYPLNKDGTGHCVWTPASGGTPASCGGDENVKEDNPLPTCVNITSKEKCWENSDCKFITFNNGTTNCSFRCKFLSDPLIGEPLCTAYPLNKDGTGYCVWTPASGDTPASCGGDENVKDDPPKDDHSHVTLIPLLLISLFVSTFL